MPTGPRNLMLLILACLAGTGCQPVPRTGTVRLTDQARARNCSIAPTVPVVLSDDSMTTVDKLAGAFYVVAFPTAKSPCGRIDPRVRELADNLYVNSVPVFQLLQPGPDCDLNRTSDSLPQDETSNLYNLADPNRIGWQAFGKPHENEILLVDPDGLIVLETRFDKIDHLLIKAGNLARQWEQEQMADMFDLD